MKIDERHEILGTTLHCKVSAKDFRNDRSVPVNLNAVLSNIDTLSKVQFEFSDDALSLIVEEFKLEPEDVLVLRISESTLNSLQVKADMSESSFLLVPLYRIEGFTDVFEEKPREQSLFDE